MRAYERFLKYVTIPTASREESQTVPTTREQFALAEYLAEELRAMGVENARVDDACYVYASLPATEGYEKIPALGFISHMDTVWDGGRGARPLVWENYDGADVALGESGRLLTAARFPWLPALKGRTLITSDGTTILGADDKAGIAEIMTMAERVITQGIPHGKLCIGFTPDEEVGRGADHFDVPGFGADFAYTVDGGAEGEIEYENFNACSAVFEIQGVSVHPGYAKGVMVNASLLAMEINAMLPARETPGDTEGYEGFYCLEKMEGDIGRASLSYLVRDHDWEQFQKRQQTLRDIEAAMQEKYGRQAVTLTIREQYRNMAEKIKPCFHLIEQAIEAAAQAGAKPKVVPIRGGTDGARLSYMGLPCPNLGTGGYAFHGSYEHITAEGMDQVVEMLVYLADGRHGHGEV